MPTFALRAILAALLLPIGGIVIAQSDPSPTIAEDQRLLPYVQPGQTTSRPTSPTRSGFSTPTSGAQALNSWASSAP